MSEIQLSPEEARVLGVLVEKELTTPDQYPLSINALVAGCNQRSNRHPTASYSEGEVRVVLEGLRQKTLAGASHPAGGRVERWRHSAREALDLDTAEIAVLAELLLRGPQTPGDLRGRASRMHAFPGLTELERVLQSLERRGLAERGAPAPGSRAPRWRQVLAPDAHPLESDPRVEPEHVRPEPPDVAARVRALEDRVTDLEHRLGELGA